MQSTISSTFAYDMPIWLNYYFRKCVYVMHVVNLLFPDNVETNS